MKTTVISSPSREIALWMSFSAKESSALIASSKTINLGDVTSARAMPIRWIWPPLSLMPVLPTGVSSPKLRAATKSAKLESLSASQTCESDISCLSNPTHIFSRIVASIIAVA